METKKLLDSAIAIARGAGLIQMDHLGKNIDIQYKGKKDLVTAIDKKCELYIIEKIKEQYPDHQILSEETGKRAGEADVRWIIDPIDGTTDYAHKHPIFAVSIGIEIKGKLTIGVVYAPMLNELYTAVKGKGAFLNGIETKVSKVTTLTDSLLATGFNPRVDLKFFDYYAHFEEASQGMRRCGAASLDLCFVAAGRLDGYFETGLKPWDIAAGKVIVEEAGGVVSKINGAPFNVEEGNVLAGNPAIHREIANYFREQGL